MPAARPLDLPAAESSQLARRLRRAHRLRERGDQGGGDDQHAVGDRDRDVLVVGVHRDGHARGQRPGRGGPRRRRDAVEAFERGGQRLDEGVRHVDRRRRDVGVLDLRLRERGDARRAPLHRLLPAIQQPRLDALPEDADLLRLVGEVHGEVRLLPVAEDAQALELAPLDVDEARRVRPASRAHLGLRHRLLLRASELLLDLQLDRQAVAVPSRDVRREPSVHGARLHDDVLQDLVERVPEVNVAVGVGRPVVQHEARAPGVVRQQLAVEVQLAPAPQHLRLALGKVRAHRKVGPGQVQRRFVVHRGAATVPAVLRPFKAPGPETD